MSPVKNRLQDKMKYLNEQGDSHRITSYNVCYTKLLRLLLYWALKAMAPPIAVAEITSEYFRIRIWAAPASLLVYALTGVLFGLGKTRTILALQLVLNISNGILNLVFVIGFDMGVPGVALGTLIAQWLCALLCLRVMVIV